MTTDAMRWTRWLRLGVLVLVLLIGGAVAWLFTADLSVLRGPLERLVTDATGREFAIVGAFSLELGNKIDLEAEDVRLGNPDWVDEPDMFQAGRVKLRLDLWSLFDEPILLELVELERVNVLLAETEDGLNNWTFGDDDDSGADIAPLPIILEQSTARDVLIVLQSPILEQPLRARVASFTQTLREDDLLDSALIGDINGRDVEIKGQLGPLESFLTGRDMQFEVTGSFDTLSIRSTGYFDDLRDPQQPSVDLSIQGPDVDDVTQMLGLADYGEGNLDFHASVVPADDGLKLTVGGNIGQLTVEADGWVSSLTDWRESYLTANASGPYLGRLLRVFDVKGVPDEAFSVAIDATRSGPLLEIKTVVLELADARFDLSGTVARFPDLDRANLDLTVTGTDLERFRELLDIPGVATGPFELNGSIDLTPEGTDILDLNVSTSLAKLSLKGPLGEPPDYVGTQLALAGGGSDFSRFAEAYRIPGMLAKPFEIAAELQITPRGVESMQKIVLRVGDQQLELDGLISLAPLERDTDLRFRGTGPDVSRLMVLAGVQEGLPSQPYDIGGRFRAEPDGYRLDDVKAEIGRGTLELDGLISRSDDLVGSDISFTARGPDLEEVLADIAAFDVPAGPFDVAGQIQRLPKILRLQEIRALAGGATTRVDADLGWPIGDSARGDFMIESAGPDVTVVLPEFENFQPDPASFEVNARGKWRGERWTFENFNIRLGEGELKGSGIFDEPPDLSNTDLQLDVNIPSLATVGLLNGERLPAETLDLTAHFTGTPEDFQMDELRGHIGETDFDGRLAIAIDREVPDVDFRFNSEVLDLRPLLGPQKTAEDTAEMEIESDGDGRVIPNVELPLDQLKRVNASLDITAGEVRFDSTALFNTVLKADLRDGALRVSDIDASGSRGRFDGEFSIVPTDASAKLEIRIDGNQLVVNLTNETPEDLDKLPLIDMEIDLTGTGLTSREIAASLNGYARLTTGEGRTRDAGLDLLFSDAVGQILTAVNPFRNREEYTEVVCSAAFFLIQDGKITTAPGIIVQTDKMNIASRGEIDLNTEKLDLNFRTAARKGIGISAGDFVNPFIRVAGTLDSPKLTMDKKGTAVAGSAAVLTAGLSLLAKAGWDRVFREKDPCGKAAEEAAALRQ
jgi:uncharacterized protein involved in outer membrane biogenesis